MRINTTRHALRSACICATVLMAGCGGGNGNNHSDAGGDTPSAPSVPQTEIRSPITTANFVAVSANAYAALSDTAMVSDSFNDLVSGVSIGPVSGPGVVRPVLNLVYLVGKNPVHAMVKGVEQTVPCETGSITMSGTMAGPGNLAKGDVVTFAANACKVSGVTLDGGLRMSVIESSGAPSETGAWSATLGVVFDRFSVSTAGQAAESIGDMEMNISQTGPLHQTLALTGKSLAITERIPGKPDLGRTMLHYRIDNAVSGTMVKYSGSYSLSGASRTHGQYLVGVKTDEAFVANAGAYPGTGLLTITGAESTATLKADGDLVRITTANASGTEQSGVSFNWAALKQMY